MPLRVETRRRLLPSANPPAPAGEEVRFPVWYEPACSGLAPQVAALTFCRQLLFEWRAQTGSGAAAPLLVHIWTSPAADGNPHPVIDDLFKLQGPTGSPLVFQAHLGALSTVPATLYPGTSAYLPAGAIRDSFDRASPLSPALMQVLKDAKLVVHPNARGLLYNARLGDLILLLSLVKAYTRNWASLEIAPVLPTTSETVPTQAPEAATCLPASAEASGPTVPAAAKGPESAVIPTESADDQSRLFVLVLDRSVEDLHSSEGQRVFRLLRDQSNDLLGQISKKAASELTVSAFSYGRNAQGEVENRVGLDGPLADRRFVRAADLAANPFRVDTAEVMNESTYTMEKRPRPVFLEPEPALAAPPQPAFHEVGQILGEWRQLHPATPHLPVVLHVTRGKMALEEISAAVAELSGNVLLYHLIYPEGMRKSFAYPGTGEDLTDPTLKQLWEVSSLLEGRETPAAARQKLTPLSRGFVVNGKFDLLFPPAVGVRA